MLSVYKTSFYCDGRAFSETEPATECHAHQVCNCTRMVSVKPIDGVVHQTKIGLTYTSDGNTHSFHKGKFEISIDLMTSFHEDGKVNADKSDDIFCTLRLSGDKHIYSTIYNNKVNFEYYVPNYGYVEYMFPDFYRGNQIDKSRLFNGHSYPKIDTTVSDEKDIWIYNCNWGNEGIKIVTEKAQDLQNFFDLGNQTLSLINNIQVTHNSQPKEVFDLLNTSHILNQLSQIEVFLRNFDLRSHELFNEVHALDCYTNKTTDMFTLNDKSE
jgi:hypothetical protein